MHSHLLQSCWLCRYGRVDFTWLTTGSIQVVTHVQALPLVSLRTGGVSGNRKILVAFVLLVFLTAAQGAVLGYSVWLRITEATSWWRVLQVQQAMHSTEKPIIRVKVYSFWRTFCTLCMQTDTA